MSIFDDIPLPIGTAWKYQELSIEILDWNPEHQKYQIRVTRMENVFDDSWRSRESIESWHGNSLIKGVEVTQVYRASPGNTRFFRRNPDKT